MLPFLSYVVEMYGEPADSQFTENGIHYDLNGLLTATLGMPTKPFLVDNLKWILKADDPCSTPASRKRVAAADLSTPILVAQEAELLVVVDGVHRLAKAVEEHRATIDGILVSRAVLDHYRLK